MRVGFFGLLTLLLIAAKLFGAITLSWVWVLSPLWIPPLVAGAIILLIIVLGGNITYRK